MTTSADDLRALTIRQPWASLVVEGRKWLETRSWPTRYRGPLAIHAGVARGGYPTLPRGAILAVATLAACVPVDALDPDEIRAQRDVGDFSLGRYAWRLVDVRTLRAPVPSRGALGLWVPTADVHADIMGPLRAPRALAIQP